MKQLALSCLFFTLLGCAGSKVDANFEQLIDLNAKLTRGESVPNGLISRLASENPESFERAVSNGALQLVPDGLFKYRQLHSPRMKLLLKACLEQSGQPLSIHYAGRVLSEIKRAKSESEFAHISPELSEDILPKIVEMAKLDTFQTPDDFYSAVRLMCEFGTAKDLNEIKFYPHFNRLSPDQKVACIRAVLGSQPSVLENGLQEVLIQFLREDKSSLKEAEDLLTSWR